jgi:hypothetical protein
MLTPKQHRKQRAAADDFEDDVEDDDATQATTQDSRWRAGVNRQAQPEAHEHQVAASQAAGAKRQANAMSKEERNKRAKMHMREVRDAQAAAALAAAAINAALNAVELEAAVNAMEEERHSKANAALQKMLDEKERRVSEDHAAASEVVWVQDSETGRWGLSTRGEIAGCYDLFDFTCDTRQFAGDSAEAHAYFRAVQCEATEERA